MTKGKIMNPIHRVENELGQLYSMKNPFMVYCGTAVAPMHQTFFNKFEEYKEMKQWVQGCTQHIKKALQAAHHFNGPQLLHILYIITCVGNYFPHGIIKNNDEITKNVYDFELLLTNRWRVFQLAIQRNVKILIQQGLDKTHHRQGTIHFLHLLQVFTPVEGEESNEETYSKDSIHASAMGDLGNCSPY